MESLAAFDAFILYHYHGRPLKLNAENPAMYGHFLCKSRHSLLKIHSIGKYKSGSIAEIYNFAPPPLSFCQSRCKLLLFFSAIILILLRDLLMHFIRICLSIRSKIRKLASLKQSEFLYGFISSKSLKSNGSLDVIAQNHMPKLQAVLIFVLFPFLSFFRFFFPTDQLTNFLPLFLFLSFAFALTDN